MSSAEFSYMSSAEFSCISSLSFMFFDIALYFSRKVENFFNFCSNVSDWPF